MERSQAEVLMQVALFMTALQEFCNGRPNAKGLPYTFLITAQRGQKYLRIVRQEVSKKGGEPLSGSVHCFIDIATGNILKADGWKRPAPQVRGNIFNANFDIGRAVGEYGAAYLR